MSPLKILNQSSTDYTKTMMMNTMTEHVALDLFSGSGWGSAMKKLDIIELGIEIMPEAVATREANGMETVFEDVWSGIRDFNLVPYHDILIASPPCFGAGTPVLTQRGSIAIEEVIVGDLVWTHKNRWRKVTDTMSRVAEAIQIGPIVTTEDHPFYSREQWREWDNSLRHYVWGVTEESAWVPAGQSKGAFWATPQEISSPTPLPNTLPEPWLAGRYVADGWVGRDGTCLAIGDGRQEPEGNWAVTQTGSSCRRFTQKTPWDEVLSKDFGSGAHNKTIPTWIFSASSEYRSSFLGGYLSGDGTSVPGGYRSTTVSLNLASQLRLLAVSLGLTSSITKVNTPDTTVIEGRAVNQADYYVVSLIENDNRYTRDRDGFRWTKQRKSPEPLGETVVYDITVEEDHSFTAWGYIVHNCQTFSIAGNGSGRQALNRVLKAVEDGVHLDSDTLLEFAATVDDRTALVLTPLTYINEFRPEYVILEQVPQVLPVWKAFAPVLESWNYSVTTGILSSEEYGLPQTRQRAFLVAKLHGNSVNLPTPTHRRYGKPSHLPVRKAGAPVLLNWVSMYEALGWGFTQRPAPTITSKGFVSRCATGTQIMALKAIQDGKFVFKNGMTESDARLEGYDAPIGSTVGIAKRYKVEAINMSPEDESKIMGYPDNFIWKGSKSNQQLQRGNAVPPPLAEAILRELLSS